MPVIIPVVVAAAAWGAAAAVGFTTFAVIAAVGATIAAVGAVTGVKELMIAGTIIGAIGGIGGLAASAGTFGSMAGSALAETAAGTTAAETASPFVTAAGDTMAGAPAVITDTGAFGAEAAGSTSQVPNTTDIVDMVNGQTAGTPVTASVSETSPTNVLENTAENASSPAIAPATTEAPVADQAGGVTDQTGGLMDQPQQPGVASGSMTATNTTFGEGPTMTPGATPPTGAETVATPQPNVVTPAATPVNPPGVTGAATVPGQTTTPAVTDSVWDKIMSILKTPGGGVLAAGVIQAGGAFLSGATSTLTPAQVAALHAQAQANTASANLSNQQAELLKTQQANMTQPIPAATRSPVTGSPAGGMIMQTPPKPTNITGQV